MAVVMNIRSCGYSSCSPSLQSSISSTCIIRSPAILKPIFVLPECRFFDHHHRPLHPLPFAICSSLRRHNRRRRRPETPLHPIIRMPSSSVASDQKLEVVIDIERLFRTTKQKFQHFVRSGTEALDDLRTMITIDEGRRVIISYRRPTLLFMGNIILLICVILFASRALVKLLLGLGYRNSVELVYRRDRSLGGREVVVGRKVDDVNSSNFRVLKNPITSSSDGENAIKESYSGSKKIVWRREEAKTAKRLPSWWPVSLLPPLELTERDDNSKQEYQRIATRLIRAILDQRMSGNDISEHDIVQFRRLCRAWGVRVFIDTTNARDSFYRLSVKFVIKTCESVDSQSTSVSVDGEDARQFVAGIADNIGLQNSHAARIVAAAVAARTKSLFLQAWALEMQVKHSEAVEELSQICLLHRIFPPEENSPEMEMVAQGLEKHLKEEQRKFLMGILVQTCTDGNRRSVAEALGLVSQLEGGIWDQQKSKLA